MNVVWLSDRPEQNKLSFVMALQDDTPKACGRTTAETNGTEN